MGNPNACSNCEKQSDKQAHSIFSHMKDGGPCAIPGCGCPQFQPQDGVVVVAAPRATMESSKEIDPAIVAAKNAKK